MEKTSTYREIEPVDELKHFVHSFWMHENLSDKTQTLTIFPDSYFKMVFLLKGKKVVNYFMTGIWTGQKNYAIPAHGTTLGCRLKILAPEFLINREVASIKEAYQQLDLSYLNLNKFDFSTFEGIVSQWTTELLKLQPAKSIQENKLRLSQLLYQLKGDISATEVSEQIFWTNRQINRYLNKYVGISLKKYLNIQKCYEAYIQIREGKLAPEKGYFDQAHFIKEVKKHTGETPKSLFDQQNDRFIQLKNIKQK